ncbi:uncharacterized protein LOC134819419 isoform X1 [Bolinopsis microptera]|uniref:uncharacterized protein LOC134819419 isoform X1 n=1 Tax=Bolinopsis microptera TaxID=2820187 RepID=UPI0030796E11
MSKMAAATKVLPPIIQDEMQKRRMMKKATTVAKFQTRMFVLYKHQLVYKSKDGKQTRGSVSVMGIKICEDVEECSFNRPHVFQVGYLEKGKMFHLYIQAKDHDMRESWKIHVRKLCSAYNDHRMQSQYHPGHYKRDKWSCCANADKNNIGCREAYSYEESRPLGSVGLSLTLPVSTMSLQKTPVMHRVNPNHRIRMPSECYDSDDMIDELLRSPTPSPQQRNSPVLLRPGPERKYLPSEYLKNRGAKARYSLQPEMPSSPLLSPVAQDSPTPSPTFTYKFEHKKYTSFKRAQSEDQIGNRGRNDSAASRPARQSLCEFEPGLYFGKSEDTYLVIRKPKIVADRTSPSFIDRASQVFEEIEEEPETESANAPLSSQSLRYTCRPSLGSISSRVPDRPDKQDSMTDVVPPAAMSTPYYCPINTGRKEAEVCNTRNYSIASSTCGIVGSDRLDSFSHTTRLDSQGSTIGSSFCESIPRTESDYQRRIEEVEEGGSGPIYVSSSMSTSADRDLDSFLRRDSTLDFEIEMERQRSHSGTYVNTHGEYAGDYAYD